jgi:UPF0716 family protein affecting phage T7 exclusion
MKNQIVVVLIVVGAIIIATPILILGFISSVLGLIREIVIPLATPRASMVSEKIRQMADAVETGICGQADKDSDTRN